VVKGQAKAAKELLKLWLARSMKRRCLMKSNVRSPVS